nr:MAG TPA: hypothetical protein [Caudoviricetes sp.]
MPPLSSKEKYNISFGRCKGSASHRLFFVEIFHGSAIIKTIAAVNWGSSGGYRIMGNI